MCDNISLPNILRTCDSRLSRAPIYKVELRNEFADIPQSVSAMKLALVMIVSITMANVNYSDATLRVDSGMGKR